MSISDATSGFARRMISLTGRALGVDRHSRTAAEDDTDSKEARRERAKAAARLATRVRKLPGRGWFPGDSL